MLLAIDVGNTNITLAVFDGERLRRKRRLETDPPRSAARYGREILRCVGENARIDAVVYGSVVPRLNRVIKELSLRRFGRRAVAVTPHSPLGVRLRVDRPSEVGADRLLNSLAVYRMHGGPAIVLDFGTAATFDCVSTKGDYLGGAILPGPELSSRALALYTAKLPRVEMRRPRRVIGKNTVECIQAGLYHGYAGMISHVLDKSIKEMKVRGGRRVTVIATGGLARVFLREIPRIDRVEQDLTLHGLRLAYGIIC